MGGGSGLLRLRNTVAQRIRVPPTFHPGPQLPTTAHGAYPAPAHHGPAPHAICLLGQTTPPSSFLSVLCPRQPRSSAMPPPWNEMKKNINSYMNVTHCFLELWEGRRKLQRWLKEETRSQVHISQQGTKIYASFCIWSFAFNTKVEKMKELKNLNKIKKSLTLKYISTFCVL